MKPWIVGVLLMSLNLIAQAADDPWMWLEDVGGEKALDWVRSENARTQKLLEATPSFEPIRSKVLAAINSRERIPSISKRGQWLYNFWQDETHVRGVWRRTTLAEFRKPTPAWETVLDLDQLAKAENENWVWKGASCLPPAHERCLLNLSRGGADANVTREFDLPSKAFVKDGFALPEAKGSVSWLDSDHVFVQTDFGAGTMTRSGYPRIVKLWKRGTPLSAATTVFEGQVSDISVAASTSAQKHYPKRTFVRRGVTFFTSEHFLRNADGTLTRLEVPEDATPTYVWDQLFVRLKSAWTVGGKTYPQGGLLAINFEQFLRGERAFDVVYSPGERTSLSGWSVTRHAVLLNELDNVKSRVFEVSRVADKWVRREVGLPGLGTANVGGLDADESDDYLLTLTDFLTPSTLYLGSVGRDSREQLKSLPAFFDASPYKVEQFEVASRDGERIPYFVIARKDAKRDGTSPTLLYGYGGFEIPMLPAYSPSVGNGWLAYGGVYVVANIRGGGEFGPRWHQAGLKANRQKVFDDFIAVAEDLITRKITSPKHLAISGGSNGGLLVGAVMVQRPDLFRAVLCSVPLLDMQRYHKLLAGASWVAEYGNPDDPKEWAYISKYSPYQNVKAGVKMPKVLFVTSTRDDRVHPGHARKMMARMQEQGHEVLYYENIEGGHAASANNTQLAYRNALQYSFLLNELK